MFNGIEGFGKVQFEEDNFFLGGMPLVDVFENPGQAVMNGSSTEETILVLMNNRCNDILSPICQ